VPELRSAFQHLISKGDLTTSDLRVLIYTLGRAMLWVVVITAFASMYGYFKAFYEAARKTQNSIPETDRAQ
jgi:hypothetical protein